MCTLLGVFLVLRGTSLTAFALSHSALFGVMIVFLITRDLNSPFLIVGAAFTSLIIVWFVEMFSKTKYVNNDAALGIIYLFFFALSILLLSRFAHQSRLSPKNVVTGSIAYVPFDRFQIYGMDLGPKLLWICLLLLILNIFFIIIFWKELKLTGFNPEYAILVGFSPTIVNFTLMGLVSLTVITVFQVAGVVMVIALLIIPPSTAYILTNKLIPMLILSLLLAVISAISGFLIAWSLGNVEIASMIGVMNGLFFTIGLLYKITQKHTSIIIKRREVSV
jgi:manganese/zinc/iron transport system permease protein